MFRGWGPNGVDMLNRAQRRRAAKSTAKHAETLTAADVLRSRCARQLQRVFRLGDFSPRDSIVVLTAASKTSVVVGLIANAEEFLCTRRAPAPVGYYRALITIDDRAPELYCVKLWPPQKAGAA